MSPDLLRLHLERSAVLRLNVIITDLHPITHSIICDEAYQFRRFIVEDMKLSAIWGDTRRITPRGVANRRPPGLSIFRIPRSSF